MSKPKKHKRKKLRRQTARDNVKSDGTFHFIGNSKGSYKRKYEDIDEF